MRRFSIAAVASLGLIVAACDPQTAAPPAPVEPAPGPAAEASPSVEYACSGGETVRAAYVAADGVAQIVYKGETHVLRTVVSASGARYAGDGLEWWTVNRDGRETATLSRLSADADPARDTGVVLLERCEAASAVVAEAASTPACRGPQLALRRAAMDAGAGNRVATLGVKNVGTRACSLSGYPGVTLADAQGAALEGVRADQEPGSYFQPGSTPGPVALEPGGEAFFDIAWSAVPHGDETACPQAARVRATAPGDTAAFSLDLAVQPCGGRVRVSPFRPVVAASPAD